MSANLPCLLSLACCSLYSIHSFSCLEARRKGHCGRSSRQPLSTGCCITKAGTIYAALTLTLFPLLLWCHTSGGAQPASSVPGSQGAHPKVTPAGFVFFLLLVPCCGFSSPRNRMGLWNFLAIFLSLLSLLPFVLSSPSLHLLLIFIVCGEVLVAASKEMRSSSLPRPTLGKDPSSQLHRAKRTGPLLSSYGTN